MLRVHMRAPDGGDLTVYYPADAQNVIDEGGVQPWLFEGSWDGKLHTGVLDCDEEGFEMYWSNGMVTEIDIPVGVPIKVGTILTVVHKGEGKWPFTVDDVRRV